MSLRNQFENSKSIERVDTDLLYSLDLFNYISCNNMSEDFTKNSKGVVFNGEDIVMKGLPYADEYNEFSTDLVVSCKETRFFEAYEGTIIRVFNFNGKWFLSTNRKLNAFKSKWNSGVSFGYQFVEALYNEYLRNLEFKTRLGDCVKENILDAFYATLKNNMRYIFLLRNDEENAVVSDPDSKIYHVCSFNNEQIVFDVDIGLEQPKELFFEDVPDLQDFVSKVDISKLQGVVGFGENRHFKVINSTYQFRASQKIDEQFMLYRYLQNRLDDKKYHSMREISNFYTEKFDQYEDLMYNIARNIHNVYIARFINKQIATVPQEQYKIIKDAHSAYLNDKVNNIVTLKQIIRIMNNQTPHFLCRMIRSYQAKNL